MGSSSGFGRRRGEIPRRSWTRRPLAGLRSAVSLPADPPPEGRREDHQRGPRPGVRCSSEARACPVRRVAGSPSWSRSWESASRSRCCGPRSRRRPGSSRCKPRTRNPPPRLRFRLPPRGATAGSRARSWIPRGSPSEARPSSSMRQRTPRGRPCSAPESGRSHRSKPTARRRPPPSPSAPTTTRSTRSPSSPRSRTRAAASPPTSTPDATTCSSRPRPAGVWRSTSRPGAPSRSRSSPRRAWRSPCRSRHGTSALSRGRG